MAEKIEKQRRKVVTEADLPQIGGMRRIRGPQIEGEAKGELGKLQRKALTTAEFLGHEPFIWRFAEADNCGTIKCRKCGREGGFALAPMRGKDPINGPLYEQGGCKR
jgi:hypothetical protein